MLDEGFNSGRNRALREINDHQNKQEKQPLFEKRYQYEQHP